MSTDTNAQEIYKAHIEFGDEHPEWMQLALDAINQWGRSEATLAHAVADALMEAYRLGTLGEYPEYQAPIVPKLIRRGKPAVVIPTIIRRTR